MSSETMQFIEPTDDEVHAELALILAYRDFAVSRQLTRFLQFVVEESLNGREDLIKERTVAMRALDRDQSFDPRVDPIVRIVAGKLRRALDSFYHSDGANGSLRIEIPKGGYRPRFTKPDSPRSGKPLLTTKPSTTPEHRRTDYPVIAVVPFTVFSAGEYERFLADSIAQDICVHLSKFSWFEVIDYLTSRPLCDNRKSPIDIATTLRADFCVAGTIRKQESVFRVTIQLTDSTFGAVLWAGSYTLGPHVDLRQQDAIVQEFVARVGDLFGMLATAVFNRSEQKPNDQLTLCETVLGNVRYQSHLADRMFQSAFKDAESATKTDPNFAWGWAALALLNIDNFILVIDRRAPDAADRARFCVRQALKADPECGLAHFSLGVYHLARGETDECVAAADRVLEYAHNSPFEIAAAGALLAMVGENERSQSLIESALDGNPRLPGWVQWARTVNALKSGEHDQALATTQSFSLSECFWDHLFRAAAHIKAGETNRAKTSLDQAQQLRPLLAEKPREMVSRLLQEPNIRADLLELLR